MTKALVLFHSQQHGNTDKMAKAVAEGLRSEGFTVTLHNANDERYPIEEFPVYDCVVFGTPDYFSYLAGTLKTFMDMSSKVKDMISRIVEIEFNTGLMPRLNILQIIMGMVL